MTQGRIEVLAPAKINLYLGVHPGRNHRGRHGVDTVMAAIDLFDAVLVEPADSLSVRTLPPVPGPMESNTCYGAAALLAERLSIEPAVSITVDKTIPAQAGLGGGSADAAATLVALARLWGVNRGNPLLTEVAAEVGADVPFFLTGGCAVMDGEGDHLVATLPQPEGAYVLVRPRGPGISTAQAYGDFDAHPEEPAPMEPVVLALETGDGPALWSAAANNLDPVARRSMGSVDEVCRWLQGRPGVHRAMVSGSGSAVFGACSDIEVAEVLAEEARDRGWWAEAASPWDRGPMVVIDELSGQPL